jgi:FlaA1/EpsC-like NDP-sugar epimerase
MTQHLLDWLHAAYHYPSRFYKRKLLMAIDAAICVGSITAAFLLRESVTPVNLEIYTYFWQILVLILLKIFIFYLKGLYRPILRYTDLGFLWTAAQAVFISSGILIILGYFQGFSPLPRSILAIDALLTLVLIVGVRVVIRGLFQHLSERRGGTCQTIVVYGAGVAGSQLARALAQDPTCRLIAFVDDNPELQQQVVQGIKVYSPAYLPQLFEKEEFDAIVLAMPGLDAARRREILSKLENLPVAIKTIPPLRQLLSGEVSINHIRNIDLVELLGREEVLPYPELLHLNVTGKSVLVTGAGGSIGSELCRQIAQLDPKCLILYELNEFALYTIDLELEEAYPHLRHFAYLGNVTDAAHFEFVLKQHRVDTIYHAAAYKHVPLVEANAAQGVYNNVFGSLTAAQSAINCGVSNFVLISTDKAVRPTNVMGASKRVAELAIQALADSPDIPTCLAMVRFGNVLGSSGSVVPRFRKQIAQGKPITVTHPEMTRYFMSIPEAVRLVMQAGAMARGGEVFLLDMGQPVRIYDLAVQMIRLSGLEPGHDIEIQFTGLRPGEKLYEELLIDPKTANPTKHPRIFCASEGKLSYEVLQPQLESLAAKALNQDYQEVIRLLKQIVPEYQPSQGNPRISGSAGVGSRGRMNC